MSSKFIVNSDIELYSTHGPLPAFKIFQAFCAKALARDFRLAGFGPQGKEISSTIKNIKEITCPVGYLMKVSGVGFQTASLIFYPGQTFLDISGKVVTIDSVRPADLLVSLNGMLNVDFVGELEVVDDMQTYYVIEFNSPMETIYANNVVICPLEVGETENSFFTK
jgi:hypothetical protein